MRKEFWVFLIIIIVFVSLYLFGCDSQIQSVSVKTTITSTATLQSTLTSTPTPTLTPLPTFTPLPIPVVSKGIFGFFESADDAIVSMQPGNAIIKTAFGIVQPRDTIEEKILIDSTISWTIFRLWWEEGDMDLTLIQPDGKIIDPSHFTDSFHEEYYLLPHQSGTWTMRIFSKSTTKMESAYMIQVVSMVATSFSGDFDKAKYDSGDRIKLSASISDGIIVEEPVHGVSIQALVQNPAKKQYSFKLFDDGLHQDGKVDDGIYANTFDNTELSGVYIFYLQISGLNNREKQPFTRGYFLTTIVH